MVRKNIADELIKLFESQNLPALRIKPGQMLWNALDKRTRGDSIKRKYKPVVLTIVSEDDIKYLINGVSVVKVREQAISRIIKEAYDQGGILSMRDIGLFLHQHSTCISKLRIQYEKENNSFLPHTGALHDMGSCVTHKQQIIFKAYVQKKDPASIARETNHSQQAVDRYLVDFYRVKILYFDNKDIDYISKITGIAKHVVKQYKKMIEEYV